MTTANKTRTVTITWLNREDDSPACLGLDEILETDGAMSECYEAAMRRADLAGVDHARYRVRIVDSSTEAAAAELAAEFHRLVASGMTRVEAMTEIDSRLSTELEPD